MTVGITAPVRIGPLGLGNVFVGVASSMGELVIFVVPFKK